MKAIKDKEAAEKKFQESEQSKKKLEQEKEEWMKKLKEISPDLADKVKDLEDGFKRLNLNSAENELEEKDFITYDEDKMKWYDALLEDKILSLQCGLQLPNVKSWDGNVKDFEKGRVTVDVNLKLGESFDINKIFTTLEKKNQAFFKCDNVSDMTKFLFPMQYWAVRFSGMLRNSCRICMDSIGPFSFLLLYCNQLHIKLSITKIMLHQEIKIELLMPVSCFKFSRDFFRYFFCTHDGLASRWTHKAIFLEYLDKSREFVSLIW